MLSLFVLSKHYDAAKHQIEAQRSGFDLERTSSEVTELSAEAGSEGYEACEDALKRYFG